ncbi:hypothetical protein E0500_039215 [Streptomyces sp. KM273126]|nr:hypothetical protein [Streptomyces sp. KM273126]MBA2813186.1 hypothetical protein [Streptomyces sp. KM273126]
MKKRSMLAIASLATGFVVAAITPSHGLDAGSLGNLDVDDTHSTLDRTIAGEAPTVGGNTLGQGEQGGHGGGGSTSRNR